MTATPATAARMALLFPGDISRAVVEDLADYAERLEDTLKGILGEVEARTILVKE